MTYWKKSYFYGVFCCASRLLVTRAFSSVRYFLSFVTDIYPTFILEMLSRYPPENTSAKHFITISGLNLFTLKLCLSTCSLLIWKNNSLQNALDMLIHRHNNFLYRLCFVYEQSLHQVIEFQLQSHAKSLGVSLLKKSVPKTKLTN